MQNTFCTHKENSSVNNRKKKMQGHRTHYTLHITHYKWTKAPQYNKCWNLEFLQDNNKFINLSACVVLSMDELTASYSTRRQF